ncbi:tRNA (adenosine(37)-N6)-threonylcarbamoyltransferase complex ATPase subunit type 1 TsaE [Pararobbsia alpina]|uniref:tRNA threonylcarbamoyladenosine biosynthesis protein TsaE n=1 Tax=Pararobbsia alpina TaxID=621374 RepID=A0A6S7B3I4_9BURK|nr:tRNA threonylcarbamoyladenosine biosynthesis protein TsaE [Pararobbsia alpina]
MPAAPAAPVSPICERQFDLPDEAATVAFGERFAAALRSAGTAGQRIDGGLHVHLLGDLGAGKTTLVRATLHALGHRGRVRSPTYTLVEPYRIDDVGCVDQPDDKREDRPGDESLGKQHSMPNGNSRTPHEKQQDHSPGKHGDMSTGRRGYDVYHFDLYRFADPAEWADAGFREYFNEGALCLVEWPEKAGMLIGVPDLSLSLDLAGEGRVLTARAYSARGKDYLDRC